MATLLRSKYRPQAEIVHEPMPAPPAPVQESVAAEIAPESTLLRPRIPAYIKGLWQMFARPPMSYDRYGISKAILRLMVEPETIDSTEIVEAVEIVTTLKEWAAKPGSVLAPPEAKLERLITIPIESYPAEWDAPNEPGAVPAIRQQTYHEWQKNHPAFSKMGIQEIAA